MDFPFYYLVPSRLLSVSYINIIILQTVAELGVVIFTALDYGLKDEEERQLSPALENVIDLMTSAGETEGSGQVWQTVSRFCCCSRYFYQNRVEL